MGKSQSQKSIINQGNMAKTSNSAARAHGLGQGGPAIPPVPAKPPEVTPTPPEVTTKEPELKTAEAIAAKKYGYKTTTMSGLQFKKPKTKEDWARRQKTE